MTRTEIDIIKRALDLLHKLVPDDEPRAVDLTPRPCPVMAFGRQYLVLDAASDVTSQELLEFYAEVAARGEVQQLSKSEFLRRLPAAMAVVFGARKTHDIERDGHKVRGFRGVGIRMDDCPPNPG